MLIRNMTVEECQALLIRASFGCLACAKNNQPYVVPIYFAYETDRLYGFSTLGQKIEWMRLNPQVCVEVDEVISHVQWESAIIRGRYEELPDIPERSSERSRAQALIEKRYLWWQTAYATNKLQDRAASLFYCIHVDDMTRRSAMPDSVESTVPLG